MARVRFLGGTSTVTGSKFLVEGPDGTVLVDCGMFQGPRKLRRRNWDDPFLDIGLPDEVLITHAHIDHTGFLPRLVGYCGYHGPIRATAATVDLQGIMLPDAAHIQEEEAAYANKEGITRHQPALPLYTEADAKATLQLFGQVDYHEWFDSAVGPACFSFAGHILGSAHITLDVGGSRVVFSGDIGQRGMPVIKDPEPPLSADLIVLESTYGDRIHHQGGADRGEMLAQAIDRIVTQRGVMIIPAFALGRTQEILYRLRELEEAGRIPELPVFLDSPMAIDATELYRRHHIEHDLEMENRDVRGMSPLRPARLEVTPTVAESKKLNDVTGPAIIISASGMAAAGRVVHHLKRRLPQPENVVVFVGYQAEGTRGRSLVDGASKVEIHGRWIPVRAEVTRLDAFSAHADQDELVQWVEKAVTRPARVALVHGEAGARRNLAERLRDQLDVEVLVPRQGAIIAL